MGWKRFKEHGEYVEMYYEGCKALGVKTEGNYSVWVFQNKREADASFRECGVPLDEVEKMPEVIQCHDSVEMFQILNKFVKEEVEANE